MFFQYLEGLPDTEIVEAESEEAEFVRLQDNRRLGIATLGALKQHPRISAFREFVEGWYLSYFHSGRRPQPTPGRAAKTFEQPRRQLG